MYTMLLCCTKEYIAETIRQRLEERAMPFPLMISTALGKGLVQKLRQSRPDILCCDERVFTQYQEAIRREKEENPELSLLVIGKKSELAQLRQEPWLKDNERFVPLLTPLNYDELRSVIAESAARTRDDRLRRDGEKCFELWKRSREIVRERYWYDLLSGKLRALTDAQLFKKGRAYDVEIASPSSQVLLILIKIRWMPPSPGEAHGDDRYYAVMNMMQDIFGINDWTAPVVAISPHDFAVIQNYYNAKNYQEALLACSRFENSYKKFLNRDAECIVSRPMRLSELAAMNPCVVKRVSQSEEMPVLQEERSDPIDRIKEYIESNLSGNLSRQSVSRAVGFHPDYMAALFREKTGQRLSEYILRRRLDRAKALLIRDEKSISRISGELGFTSPSYFSEVFRREVGVTPSEYRARYMHSPRG